MNNHGYAALDEFVGHFGIGKPIGTTLTDIDFAELARGMGCAGTTARRPDDLPKALREVLESSTPALLDVHVS